MLLLLLPDHPVFAGSAQWRPGPPPPQTGDWNTPGNWNPATVPNGPADLAAFGVSSITGLSLSANTQVNTITFNAGASAYTITASPALTLTISGTGIVNSSGIPQNFVAAAGVLAPLARSNLRTAPPPGVMLF